MCRYKIPFLLLAGLLQAVVVFSQEPSSGPESEYFRIREAAFSGYHETARADARKLVNENPDYGDARILLARIMAWQKDYDNALAAIDTLLESDPENKDAAALKKDILRWSAAVNEAETSTDIITGYSFDKFTTPYSRFWQVFKAGAGHKAGWGSGFVYMNTGLIHAGSDEGEINSTEFQLEAEAYPKISAKNYAWLSYAYSPGRYFPGHRAAAEFWQVLPSGWGASAGLSYYYFDRNIFLAGASVEKYAGKYWLSAKSFIYFKDGGPTFSYYLNARKYFKRDDYLQLTLGAGTAPDEPFDMISDLERLSANSIRIAFYNKISNKLSVRIGAGYSDEEYAGSLRRNRYEGNITLGYSINKK